MHRIVFVRHAQSASNAGLQVDTPDDIPLTEKGMAQAHALAGTINEKPDQIVVTPYPRTRDTALPLARKFGMESKLLVLPLEEFTYLDWRNSTGMTEPERQPLRHAYWDKLDPDFIDGPEAESFNQFRARIAHSRKELSGMSGLTYVFTHGLTLRQIWLEETSPESNSKDLMAQLKQARVTLDVPNAAPFSTRQSDGRIIFDSPLPKRDLTKPAQSLALQE